MYMVGEIPEKYLSMYVCLKDLMCLTGSICKLLLGSML